MTEGQGEDGVIQFGGEERYRRTSQKIESSSISVSSRNLCFVKHRFLRS